LRSGWTERSIVDTDQMANSVIGSADGACCEPAAEPVGIGNAKNTGGGCC